MMGMDARMMVNFGPYLVPLTPPIRAPPICPRLIELAKCNQLFIINQRIHPQRILRPLEGREVNSPLSVLVLKRKVGWVSRGYSPWDIVPSPKIFINPLGSVFSEILATCRHFYIMINYRKKSYLQVCTGLSQRK